jgi:RNA polymerase sigma-70 factor (ECF subfamily)
MSPHGLPEAVRMAETDDQAAQLQGWIDRLQTGDQAARDELLGHACERLRRLTHKMLKGYPRVKRWEETDDVLQNALLRLWRALEHVRPRSVREFCGLAALQIRRELIDLVRRHYGPEGAGAHHASIADESHSSSTPQTRPDAADSTHDPGALAHWTEFHQLVGVLPPEELEVFDLVWYQGLTQPAAASLLEISEPTLKRRWWSARRRLHAALQGHLPGT